MTLKAIAADNFRHDINALRALAVLAVIAYHFDILGVKSGYIGVDIFFVISGFLIGGQIISQLINGKFSAKAFFASRIRRIVPALVAVCLVVYIWGWFFQLPQDYRLLVRSILTVIFFVSNIGFSSQTGYFDLGSLYKPFLHTWSLSIETQFYLLLPILLILIFKFTARRRLVLLIATGVLSFGAMLYIGSNSADKVFYSFLARTWEFIVGCVIAFLVHSNQSWMSAIERYRKALLAAAWIGLVSLCFLLPKAIIWPGLWTLGPTILSALIILLGTGQKTNWLENNRPVQHAGNISYSLYLWHWPLLVCWNLVNGEAMATKGTTLLVLLGGTWLLALLSWRFIEQPFRTGRKFWTAPKLYSGYAITLAAFIAISATIWVQGGVPQRLPAYLHGAQVAAVVQNGQSDHGWDLPRHEKSSTHFSFDLGDTKSIAPSVVLWGDSHTLQLLESFRKAIEGKKISGYLFHRPGCEPAFPDRARGDMCDPHNEDVLNLLERTPSIKTIVIDIRQNESPRVDRTVETIKRLLDKGYRVIFLGPLPEANRPVAQEWTATQLMHRVPVVEMTIKRDARSRVDSYNQRHTYWQKSISEIQARYPERFTAIDLTDIFCNESQCWLVRDGVGLFRDMDHLTPIATQIVMPRIMRALATGLN